jgi:hypothetical protein
MGHSVSFPPLQDWDAVGASQADQVRRGPEWWCPDIVVGHVGSRSCGMGMPTIVALAGQRRGARSCRGKPAVSHLDCRAAPWPSSRLGARPEQASRCWSRSRDIVGRSQIASRPRRMSWASTTTRPAPARLVPPRLTRHARLRHYGRHSASRKHRDAPKADAQDDEHLSPPLIRWSVQKIRRIAVRLARRRIHSANITAWSL